MPISVTQDAYRSAHAIYSTYQHHEFRERHIVAFPQLDATVGHVVPETTAHGGGSHSLLSSEDRSEQHLMGAAEGSEVLD